MALSWHSRARGEAECSSLGTNVACILLGGLQVFHMGLLSSALCSGWLSTALTASPRSRAILKTAPGPSPLSNPAGVLQQSGSSTELALMRLALQAGADPDAARRANRVLARVPFTYTRKRSLVVVQGREQPWRSSGKHRYYKE